MIALIRGQCATTISISFKRLFYSWQSLASFSAATPRPGRPKTNPLSRDEQLRINKRNQLKRDKVRGLKRVELKLNAQAVDALNELAEARNISRSELIEEILMKQLMALRGQGLV